ncbi:MAG TPA: M20 family metallopeptidase [Gemmatimonadaceae bacterium]|nr:M20 family metallopeptidase [Gemmatimonadaceae bacterium]
MLDTERIPRSLAALFPDVLRESLVTLRRDLHENPELSRREERTANQLHAALEALRPAELYRVGAADGVTGVGLIARMKGRDAGVPPVAIRGDIDALPIQENTGLPFASRNAGVMHACGHDVHATWAVGAAHLLAAEPAAGDVIVVLQPAEETGSGALVILESGALDDAAAIFGAHVDRRFEVGQVVAEAGPLAAAADTFDIELIGAGAHGARPHESADPIVGAGALIGALQTIVSRRLNPAHPAVVTIGTVHAGSAHNIIPGSATLSGTLRAVDPDTRRFLHEELRRVTESIAAAYRLEARIELGLGPPPIVNPQRAAAWAREAAVSVLGAESVVPLGTLNMGGEDFAHYMERIPGCFIRVGARERGGEPIPAHSPRFYAAEESIFVGAAVLAESARVASRALDRRS